MSDIVSLFIPLLFCGDEVTDILYIIFNWDTFASAHLKNAALAFVILNGIVNFFFAIMLVIFLKGFKQADGLKIVALICFCAWIPVLGIMFFLLYFKFIDLAIKWKKGDQFFTDVQTVGKVAQLLHYCELFVEDIPQLIIQPLNNTANGQWSQFEYISFLFTVGTIGYQILNFMFCKQKHETVHHETQSELAGYENNRQSFKNTRNNILPPIYNPSVGYGRPYNPSVEYGRPYGSYY